MNSSTNRDYPSKASAAQFHIRCEAEFIRLRRLREYGERGSLFAWTSKEPPGKDCLQTKASRAGAQSGKQRLQLNRVSTLCMRVACPISNTQSASARRNVRAVCLPETRRPG